MAPLPPGSWMAAYTEPFSALNWTLNVEPVDTVQSVPPPLLKWRMKTSCVEDRSGARVAPVTYTPLASAATELYVPSVPRFCDHKSAPLLASKARTNVVSSFVEWVSFGPTL